MANSDGRNIIVNRVISFAAGALLMFVVLNFSVVSTAKKKNVELTAALDASKFEAGRLLNDATALLEARDYDKSRESLAILFERYPGSAESVDGKTLLAKVEASNLAADTKWANVLSSVKQKWMDERIAVLRSESETARALMEKDMNEKITKEWDSSLDQNRKEWEATSTL